MKNTINLLKKLEMDYDHPWPNEDGFTRQHRMILLEDIREEIENLQNNNPNKNVKVPKYDLLTEGFAPDKLPQNCKHKFPFFGIICKKCGYEKSGY